MKSPSLSQTVFVSAISALALGATAFAEDENPSRERHQQEHVARQALVESAKAQQKLASEAIASELRSDLAKSATVAELLGKLVAAKDTLKRSHLETARALRSELTLEQLEKMEEGELLDPDLSDEQAELVKSVIAPKAKKLHQTIQSREEAESPLPKEVPGMVGRFHRQMRERDIEGAAKSLDEALALL